MFVTTRDDVIEKARLFSADFGVQINARHSRFHLSVTVESSGFQTAYIIFNSSWNQQDVSWLKVRVL